MICHEIVEFMNNDINTRDYGVYGNSVIIKTFKDDFENSFLSIELFASPSRFGLTIAVYWFNFDRDWWKKQDSVTKHEMQNMTFEINNKVLCGYAFVSAVSLATIGVSIKYSNCIFDENIRKLMSTYSNIKLENCIIL